MIKSIVITLFLLAVIFEPSAGRPSLLPIEIDESGVAFGQTDQMQYIDKTELISILPVRSRGNETDGGNMTTIDFPKSSREEKTERRQILSVISFGRNTTKEDEQLPEYNVIKLN